MTEHSLKKRYAAKLVAQIFSGGINAIIVMLAPRLLGVVQFGNFSYVTSFFQNIIYILNNGPSMTVMVQLSHKNADKRWIPFYMGLLVCLGGFLFLGITGVWKLNWTSLVWPGQDVLFVYLGALYALCLCGFQFFILVSDALGLTVYNEFFKIFQRVLTLLFLGLFVIWMPLTLKQFFFANYLAYFFYALLVGWFFFRKGIFSFVLFNIRQIPVKAFCKGLMSRGTPLVLADMLGIFSGMYDIWLLQFLYGSMYQGYYGVGAQLAPLLCTFSIAISPLLMREFSKAYAEDNLLEVQRIYMLYVPLIFAITSIPCVFLAWHGTSILSLIAGNAFSPAGLSFSLFMMTPIFQSYGLINNSLMYATHKHKWMLVLSAVGNFVSVALTTLVLSQNKFFGLGLGVEGLALKVLFIEILFSLIRLKLCSRYIGFLFRKIVIQSFYLLSFLVFVAFLTPVFFFFVETFYWNLLLSGVLYIGIVFFSLYYFSNFFLGIERSKLNTLFSGFLQFLGIKNKIGI